MRERKTRIERRWLQIASVRKVMMTMGYWVGVSTNLLRGEWAQREREGWWGCVPSAMNSPNATDPAFGYVC